MKSHFNLKSLAFYGGAIGFVVVLFSVVTAYGEANIKAPPIISGRYRINLQNSSGCQQNEPLILSIQQSGVYLSGSLLSAENNEKTEIPAKEKPSLDGKTFNQSLTLSGSTKLPICNNSSLTKSSLVKIEGKVKGETLTGKMNLNQIPQVMEFTAKKEAIAESTEKHNSH